MRRLDYVVDIETWGEGIANVDHDVLFDLHDALAEEGASGIATGWGGTAGGPNAVFHIMLDTATRDDASALPAAAAQGARVFLRACRAAGLADSHKGIARIDVMPAMYAHLEVEQRSEELLGVAEIAALLGVSRQRVYELRAKPEFPPPPAELAAGPVWTRAEIEAFLLHWDRKPGRPKQASA